MNKLKTDKKEAVISALVEGNSIRSTERMTGVHRDTIMRLLLDVSAGCAAVMDETMRNLHIDQLQVDETWCYVAKKQRHVRATDDSSQVGDKWIWVGLDSYTKLVPCYRVGQRTAEDARAFIADLASRVTNRVQISSDALSAYVDAIEQAFGTDVDYGQIVKSYEAEAIGPGRYSPPHVSGAKRYVVLGKPYIPLISTSHVERQNLTMRMQMRRLTRLTNGFSKKLENLKAAVSLHFCFYNFARVHGRLRVTPAMEAGISNHVWSLSEIVSLAQ